MLQADMSIHRHSNLEYYMQMNTYPKNVLAFFLNPCKLTLLMFLMTSLMTSIELRSLSIIGNWYLHVPVTNV